jgi:hypothetical protein
MKHTVAVADRLIICNINNNMARKTTVLALLVLLLIIIVRPLAADEAAAGNARKRRPVLGLGIQGGVAVANEPIGSGYASDFFTPKAQAVGAMNALLDIPVYSGFSLGIGFQLHGVTASNPAGGWLYKSHWGGGLRFSGAYVFDLTEPARPLQVRLGASAGGSFNYDLQSLTTLFFFYPGIFLEPYLELDNSKREKHSLALVLPIDYYFRRDLEFYGSIGIGLMWRYTLL